MKRSLVIYNPIRFTGEAWIPVLWAQAKTYYERHGQKKDQWRWLPCYADIWADQLDKVKVILGHQEPDVFAVSLYVWNYQIAHRVAEWVKMQWPHCLVITGGPHQYFKHDQDWFRKHPYIDASLPGECYGELAFQEMLDNLDDDGRIDWNQVSDICYPKGRSRLPVYSEKSIKQTGKKNFDYDWSAFRSQTKEITHYINYAKTFDPTTKILTIFETTRGCPYGCTYCDWGGGINSSVIKKSTARVYDDIDSITEFNLDYLYFADANFGMFGDRDIAILEYLARQRRDRLQTFTIGYGGFAKTENRLPYIKKILEIDIKRNLSALGEIKVSMQSLDDDVLSRIERKNVSLDKQLTILEEITRGRKIPIYVELIFGLPGMTLSKFYHELDVLGAKRLSIQWYPWILLPEAPAYSRHYREQQQLDTVIKTAEWYTQEDEKNNYNEVVVGTATYDRSDYLEMLLSSGTYKLLVQAGFYSESLDFLQSKGVGVGEICQQFHDVVLKGSDWHDHARLAWQAVLDDAQRGCFLDVEGHPVYMGLYVPALAFMHPDWFITAFEQWVHDSHGVPWSILLRDRARHVDRNTFLRTCWHGPFKIDYQKTLYKHMVNDSLSVTEGLRQIMLMFMQFKNTGSILRGHKTFLGLSWSANR